LYNRFVTCDIFSEGTSPPPFGEYGDVGFYGVDCHGPPGGQPNRMTVVWPSRRSC